MRRLRRNKKIIFILLLILICFNISLMTSYLIEHKYTTRYRPVYEMARSVKRLSFGELKLNLDRIILVCKLGYKETISQFINIATVSDVDKDSELDSYYIFIDGNSYEKLISDLPNSGREEVDGYLVYNSKRIQDVKLRFRGNGINHLLFTQKSWRIKTDKNGLINGSRKINLVNPSEMSAMTSTLSHWVASNMGVLSTGAQPVRVFINNQYMGVAVALDQTDEYFLMKNDKIVSEIYAGDLIKTESGLYGIYLYRDDNIKAWDKMSSSEDIAEDDYSMLVKFTNYVLDNYKKAFSYDIEKFVDIDKYLKWKASMIIIGSTHNTNMHNNKFYFDPSSGKWEPILWDPDSFSYKDHPYLNVDIVFSDLDKIIMKNPEYAEKMYKNIWNAINGDISQEKILSAFDKQYNDMKDAIYSDKYKDVNHHTDPYATCRDYTNKDFDESIREMRWWIKERYKFIEESLSNTALFIDEKAISRNNFGIKLDVEGVCGVKLKEIELAGVADNVEVELYRDINFNEKIDSEDILVCKNDTKNDLLIVDEILYPNRSYIDMQQIDSIYAPAELIDNSVSYSYIIDIKDYDCSLICIKSIDAVNSITNEAVEAQSGILNNVDESLQFTTHLWKLEKLGQENIVFKSGQHIIGQDILINRESSLTIEEGAVLKVKQGVSIYAFGQVDIKGTEENPVIIEPYEEGKPWGVFAIQGHYNRDLVHKIDHAVIRGGGVAQTFENTMYTGMLSAYNSNIDMTNTSIISNRVGDDGFNAKQCDVMIDKCYFYDAFSDAVDLDYATGDTKAF